MAHPLQYKETAFCPRIPSSSARDNHTATRTRRNRKHAIVSHSTWYRISVRPITRKGDQPLFVSKWGKAMSPNSLVQVFGRFYRAAGLTNASSHSGRKTFLTSLSSKGISVFVLAGLAGHKSITTTQRYITVNDDLKRRAVELV